MDITIRDYPWNVLNMQLTTTTKKYGIIGIWISLGLAFIKIKGSAAWLNVVNTLEIWERIINFIPDFTGVWLLLHAGIEVKLC